MTVGLLALIIIPIFFKNNIMKKTKIRSIKTFERLLLYSAKATHTGLLWIRNSHEANFLT